MFVAIVAEKTTADNIVVENVKRYLQRAVHSGLHMLPKETSAIGDCYDGDDDSDKE